MLVRGGKPLGSPGEGSPAQQALAAGDTGGGRTLSGRLPALLFAVCWAVVNSTKAPLDCELLVHSGCAQPTPHPARAWPTAALRAGPG